MKPRWRSPCVWYSAAAACLPLRWQVAERKRSVVTQVRLIPRSGKRHIFSVTAACSISRQKCGHVSKEKPGPSKAEHCRGQWQQGLPQ